MRVGASRTAPDLTITAPHRSALAPAAQPRPASPRRALPAARVSKRVPIPCKSGVPVQCSLTIHQRSSVEWTRTAFRLETCAGDAVRDPGRDQPVLAELCRRSSRLLRLAERLEPVFLAF